MCVCVSLCVSVGVSVCVCVCVWLCGCVFVSSHELHNTVIDPLPTQTNQRICYHYRPSCWAFLHGFFCVSFPLNTPRLRPHNPTIPSTKHILWVSLLIRRFWQKGQNQASEADFRNSDVFQWILNFALLKQALKLVWYQPVSSCKSATG